jgi:hypothetical protein
MRSGHQTRHKDGLLCHFPLGPLPPPTWLTTSTDCSYERGGLAHATGHGTLAPPHTEWIRGGHLDLSVTEGRYRPPVLLSEGRFQNGITSAYCTWALLRLRALAHPEYTCIEVSLGQTPTITGSTSSTPGHSVSRAAERRLGSCRAQALRGRLGRRVSPSDSRRWRTLGLLEVRPQRWG